MRKFSALLVVVLLSSCTTMQPLEEPQVTLVDLRILDVTLFEQRYGVKIRVTNPNPVDLPITGMNLRLDVNDAEVGSGVSPAPVTVPAYGDAVMEITLVSNLARVLDQIRAIERGQGQSLRYRLAGGISVANRFGKLPFDYRGEIGQLR